MKGKPAVDHKMSTNGLKTCMNSWENQCLDVQVHPQLVLDLRYSDPVIFRQSYYPQRMDLTLPAEPKLRQKPVCYLGGRLKLLTSLRSMGSSGEKGVDCLTKKEGLSAEVLDRNRTKRGGWVKVKTRENLTP